MDLRLVDITDDYKIKTDATQLELKKITRYTTEKKTRLHFVLRVIVMLVVDYNDYVWIIYVH